MANQKNSAQAKALRFLDQSIFEALRTNQNRLPTITTLASSAGVAKTTMHRAVLYYKGKGILQAQHGSGIRIAGHETYPQVSDATLTEKAHCESKRWEQLSTQIEQDIFNGMYPLNTLLPQSKQLCYRYGVNYRTLKKSLHLLIHRNIITPYKRSYRVSFAAGKGHGNRIALITRAVHDGSPIIPTERTREYYAVLERDCAKTELNLEVITIASTKDQDTRLADAIKKGISDHDEILGFIFFTVTFSTEYVLELTKLLASTKKPIALLDEGGCNFKLLPKLQRYKNVRMFTISVNISSGNNVGRYLMSLNHRKIAFITDAPQALWSQNRCNGICEVYSGVGEGDAVQTFTVDPEIRFRKLEANKQKIFSAVEALFLASTGKNNLLGPLGRALQESQSQLTDLITLNSLREVLRPVFEKTLSSPQVTCWVASCDPIALLCLDFLIEQGIKVPEEISLMGYDDIIAAFQNNLTSYNFNASATIMAMLNYILDPRSISHRKNLKMPFEAEGFVNERGTTARSRLS